MVLIAFPNSRYGALIVRVSIRSLKILNRRSSKCAPAARMDELALRTVKLLKVDALDPFGHDPLPFQEKPLARYSVASKGSRNIGENEVRSRQPRRFSPMLQVFRRMSALKRGGVRDKRSSRHAHGIAPDAPAVDLRASSEKRHGMMAQSMTAATWATCNIGKCSGFRTGPFFHEVHLEYSWLHGACPFDGVCARSGWSLRP